MALVIEFTCDLPNGVHARPASLVETLCNRFSSAIEWRNLRRGTGGNAKSALAIIGSNTLKGDACQLLISGEDEAEAFAAITAFMRDEFPHCDAPLPAAPTLDVQPVPESLSRLNPTLFHAHPVCAGSAGGTLVHLKSRDLHELGELPVAVSPEQEQAALDNGLRLLVKDIELRLLDNDGTASAIWKLTVRWRRMPRCASTCLVASSPASVAPGRLSPPATTSAPSSATPATAICRSGYWMYATFASSCYSISTAKLVSRRRASCGKRPFALPTS